MNTTTTSPLTSLSTRAMLTDFTLKFWSGRKHDRAVSDEIATTHGASNDSGRYNKRLVARSALDELAKVARQASAYHHFNTLPWLESGMRIFPSQLYFDYTTQMHTFQRDFDAAAERFASAYPQVIEDAKASLNGLFKASDYPTAGTIRRHFAFKLTLFPLPDQTDFRVDLGDADVAQLRADFQIAQDAIVGQAIADVVSRIQEVVGRMSERLHAYRVTEDGTEGVFRDSLVTNIRDLVAILPALNITEDAKLDDLITRVRDSLCKHAADVLRDDATARIETAVAADEILAHVNAFFA